MSSHEIQLTRDKFGRLPYLSNWSRHEPAFQKTEHTDHWCKSKHRSVTLFTTGSDDKINFYPEERIKTEKKVKNNEAQITPHYRIDGCMKHIGTKSFKELLSKELNGKLPGSSYTRREPLKAMLRTSANERARDNFEYWYREPKPMKHSFKTWFGQGGNVLGTMKR